MRVRVLEFFFEDFLMVLKRNFSGPSDVSIFMAWIKKC